MSMSNDFDPQARPDLSHGLQLDFIDGWWVAYEPTHPGLIGIGRSKRDAIHDYGEKEVRRFLREFGGLI
jgi:hypothetical protein